MIDRQKAVLYLASVAFATGAATLYYIGRRAASPAAIQNVERSLTLARLPARFDGLRLLHLSDLHLTPRRDFSAAIAARAQAAHPDLVGVTGDLVSGRRGVPLAQRLLERLAAHWPTYVVLGNADHAAGCDRDLPARWAASGAMVLVNQGQLLRPGDDGFWVAGVDDPHWRLDDPGRALAGAPPEAFRLLLAHSPEVMQHREARQADLVLSGHTHGGQVRLPWVGALVTRSRLGRRYSQGVFRLDGTTLVVTSGVGTTRLAVRFLCPPEMVLWVLGRGGRE